MTATRGFSGRCLTGAGLLLLILPALAQHGLQDDSRVGPAGPYRSKMRIVEDTAPIAPPDVAAALAALEQDPYGSALLLRNLGYAAVADGDDATAVRRLREALTKNSLAPIAQAQIRTDLIRLWARADDDESLAAAYGEWRTAGHDFDSDAHLAAARAYTRRERFAEAEEALDRALTGNADVAVAWRELQVFVLSALERFDEAAAVKAQFFDPASASREDWLQLAGLYQAAGNESATLAAMDLGYRAAKLTRPSDVANLALLYRRAGLPDYTARVLADNLARGILSDNAANWLALAEARLAARDDEAALEPLIRAAALGSDPLVELQLGRLHFRLGQHGEAIASLRRALRGDLAGEQGRALLLLGEAYVETGAMFRARSAFRKASEMGGSYSDAQAWLDRLQSEAADEIAAGELASTALPPMQAETAIAATTPPTLPTKTVHRQRFYYTKDAATFDNLPTKSVNMARRLRNSVRRERLSASGPLHFIVLADPGSEQTGFELQVGIPVRTRVAPRGAFRNRDILPFFCVHREFRGDAAALGQAWAALAADVRNAGYEPTGETRTVVLNFAPPGQPLLFELQVGVRPTGGDEG